MESTVAPMRRASVGAIVDMSMNNVASGALAAALARERARAVLGRRMLPGAIVAFGAAGGAVGASPWPEVSALALAAARFAPVLAAPLEWQH